MEFEKVIKTRQATRKFTNKKVSNELIEKILASGRIAPTAKNNQPQVIYVIETTDSLKKIDKVTPCRYGAQACLLICSDKNIAWSKDEYSTYEMDATIVATHMMLEATNLGIDNIWIRNFDRKEVQKEFSLSDNIIPICIIPLGYKEENHQSPFHNQRKELSETVKYIWGIINYEY